MLSMVLSKRGSTSVTRSLVSVHSHNHGCFPSVLVNIQGTMKIISRHVPPSLLITSVTLRLPITTVCMNAITSV